MPAETATAIVSLLMGGVLERFPRLRVCFAHGGGRPKCRIEECSFGNFVTDAMAAEMGVEMALINSGAIKGSFDPNSRNGNWGILVFFWGNVSYLFTNASFLFTYMI